MAVRRTWKLVLLALACVATVIVTTSSPAAASAPGAPVSIVLTTTATGIDYVITPPTDDGGSPVTGYEIVIDGRRLSVSEANGTLFTPCRSWGWTVLEPNCIWTGTYTATAAAVNADGTGPTVTSNVVTTPDTPQAPTGVTATSSSDGVDVGWSPPGDDGGSPILGYQVIADPSGVTTAVAAGEATAHLATLLQPAGQYTFRVRAFTSTATSAWSAPSATVVSPAGPAMERAGFLRLDHTEASKPRWEVLVADLDGANAVSLGFLNPDGEAMSTSFKNYRWLDWAGDGSAFAYLRRTGSDWAVVVSDPSGSSSVSRPVSENAPQGFSLDIDISSDGSRIVARGEYDGSHETFDVIDVLSGDVTTWPIDITTPLGNLVTPQWQPGGDAILLSSSFWDNDQPFFLLDPNTGEFTELGATGIFGEWLPDGSGIRYWTFAARQAGNPPHLTNHEFVYDLTSGQSTPVTPPTLPDGIEPCVLVGAHELVQQSPLGGWELVHEASGEVVPKTCNQLVGPTGGSPAAPPLGVLPREDFPGAGLYPDPGVPLELRRGLELRWHPSRNLLVGDRHAVVDPATGRAELGPVLRIPLFGGFLERQLEGPFLAPSVPETVTSKFVPLTPERLFDTRDTTPVGPDDTLDVTIAGTGNVPADATAVVINLTALNATAPGFVTTHPTGTLRPLASSVNLAPGQVIPNLVTVPIGDNGKISFYAKTQVDLVADLLGYYTPADTATAGRLVPLGPDRLLDTRDTLGPAGPDTPVTIDVPAHPAVPDTGVAAAVITITATATTTPGFVTAHPGDQPLPVATNVIARPGQTVTNLAIIPLGADGTIALHTSAHTHLVVDIAGYITDDTAPDTTTGLFVALTPRRSFDTRTTPAPVGKLAPGTEITVTIAGTPGIPTDATAVLQNITANQSTASGFITAYPTGIPRPTAATFVVTGTNTTRGGAALAPTGTNGTITYYTHGGAHLITDTTGYYTD